MAEEETLIAKGEDAEALLSHPAFDSAIQSMVETCFQTFAMSKYEDKEARESAYYQYIAVTGLVNTLKQSIAVRDEIKSKT